MKRIAKTLLILTLCVWTISGTETLSASNPSRITRTSKVEVRQHRPQPERPMPRVHIMNDKDFQFLYKTIRKKSFEKDQLEILSVGVLDNYFSCRQCDKIMSLYSFDDDKLKVLKIMASHIADKENARMILDSFRFESDRRKAADILGLRR